MALFLVFGISHALNSTRSFKNLAEKGCCCFLEPFARLFMQLQGKESTITAGGLGLFRNLPNLPQSSRPLPMTGIAWHRGCGIAKGQFMR